MQSAVLIFAMALADCESEDQVCLLQLRGKNSASSSMQQQVQQLQEMAENVDGIEATVFDEVFVAIRNTLTQETATAVSGIEGQLNTYTAAIRACAAEKGFAAASGPFNAAEATHTAASAALVAAIAEKEAACALAARHCNGRDVLGKELYDAMHSQTYCEITAPEAFDEASVESHMHASGFSVWAAEVETGRTTWAAEAAECTRTTEICHQKTVAVAEAEAAKTLACSNLDAAGKAGKTAYDLCYDAKAAELEGYRLSAAKEMGAHKQSIHDIESLVCDVRTAAHDVSAEQARREALGAACAATEEGAVFSCSCHHDTEHGHSYNTRYAVPALPKRDASWDGKGCSPALTKGLAPAAAPAKAADNVAQAMKAAAGAKNAEEAAVKAAVAASANDGKAAAESAQKAEQAAAEVREAVEQAKE